MPEVARESDIDSKLEFAAAVGVTPSALSQWIARGKISGDALVGHGNRALRVSIARSRLGKSLDTTAQGRPRKAPVSGRKGSPDAPQASHAPPLQADEAIEERIKAARFAALELANAKAREEAAARSGRYVLADDAKQELGRLSARFLTLFEGSLSEFANAIVAKAPTSPRDALLVLRETWRDIRVRQAKSAGEEAAALPARRRFRQASTCW